MDAQKAAVARKRKSSGPSTWPRVYKAGTGFKQETPKSALSGRLTERQQLALALEESRRDSLSLKPDQKDVEEEEGQLQRSESGDQSSSLRGCGDEAATRRSTSSSRPRPKQVRSKGSTEQPCSPCRTSSHEHASTSGRATGAGSKAAKPVGTLFSTSMSSETSKQSASTAFKVPFARKHHASSAFPEAVCPPVSLPEEGELSHSDPPSPVSQAERPLQPANGSSSSASELTAEALQAAEGSSPLQHLLEKGTARAESTVVSNSLQLGTASDRLGSLTPSVSHSASPSNYSAAPPCKKLRLEAAAADKANTAPSTPVQSAGIKIRVKLASASSSAKAAAKPLQPASAPLLPSKRVPEASKSFSAGAAASKRLKTEQQEPSAYPAPSRASSFRKPRSKPAKGASGSNARLHQSRQGVPASVFEDLPSKPAEAHDQKQQKAPASGCLLRACSQLASLDQQHSDAATTLLPRSSAFLELASNQEEDASDSDDDSPKELPPEPSLEPSQEASCDVALASRLLSLRLSDLSQQSQDLEASQKSKSGCQQPALLSGKLAKAFQASHAASDSQPFASSAGFQDSCSFLYKPLKAAAISWDDNQRGRLPRLHQTAANASLWSHQNGRSASLSQEHAVGVLAAMESWVQSHSVVSML